MPNSQLAVLKVKRGPSALVRLDLYEIGYATDANCLLIGTPDGPIPISNEVDSSTIDHIKMDVSKLVTESTVKPSLDKLISLVNSSTGEQVPVKTNVPEQLYSVYQVVKKHLGASAVIKDTSRTTSEHIVYLTNLVTSNSSKLGGGK